MSPTTEFRVLTPATVRQWLLPLFCLPPRVGPDRVVRFKAELAQNGGVFPGHIRLARLGSETYILDGSNQIKAFLDSKVGEAIATVITHDVESQDEMGRLFCRMCNIVAGIGEWNSSRKPGN